jgi:hypothetical protein
MKTNPSETTGDDFKKSPVSKDQLSFKPSPILAFVIPLNSEQPLCRGQSSPVNVLLPVNGWENTC